MTASFVVVIPAINEARTRRLLKSIQFATPDQIVLIDNGRFRMNLPWEPGTRYAPGRNVGVAVSWNLGIDAMIERRADYLVILSTSVEFTATGGRKWAKHLGEDPGGLEAIGMGWHLIAIGRPVFEAVGRFDERFSPAYYEDNDFLHRMAIAGLRRETIEGVGPFYEPDARLEGSALHIESPGVDYGASLLVYRRKWGGDPGHETRAVPRWEVPL